MNGQNVIRKLIFMVFFSIGALALSGSILCDDLIRYYQNRQLLSDSQETLNHLRDLNTEYDALLKQLEEDPNLLKRIAPAILGVKRDEPNTVYPEATPQLVAAVRELLKEKPGADTDPNQHNISFRIRDSGSAIPAWLSRCSQPRRRIGLFFAGAGIILISLICFSPVKKQLQNTGLLD